MNSFRKSLALALDAQLREKPGLSIANRVLVITVLLSTLLVVLGLTAGLPLVRLR